MGSARRALAAIGTLALVAGAVLLPPDPVRYLWTPILACLAIAAVLAGWPRSGRIIGPAAIAGAAASLLVTALFLVEGSRIGVDPDAVTGLWILLEPAALLGLVYLASRWLPRRAAVWSSAVAGAAIALIMQRHLPNGWAWGWTDLSAGMLWSIPTLAVVAVAARLRWRTAERARALVRARQEQRLELARDLHDFVAHDVSEILARAQAGRIVLAAEDSPMSVLLEQIETAGLRALASMDRTVRVLHDEDGARVPVGGLADLDDLVERFGSAGSAAVSLERRVSGPVGREVGAVAYRCVVEALTNVRRHAPTASAVRVVVDDADGRLTVTVADDGAGGAESGSRARAGVGLSGMVERVERLGGSLEAGPGPAGGWRLAVRLPS